MIPNIPRQISGVTAVVFYVLSINVRVIEGDYEKVGHGVKIYQLLHEK